MITKIEQSNQGSYVELFDKVVELLSTHNLDYEEVAPSPDANEVIMPLKSVNLTSDEYNANEYYYKNTDEDTGNITYEVCKDTEFDNTKDYYETQHITTLNELFAYMQDIINLKPQLTRLPLDDTYLFEINTNTRVIKTPTIYKTNGISVQGDDISEIIYFKIPRYYGSMDLMNQDVMIEWEDAKGVTGVDAPFAVDAEAYENYIIFGWAVRDEATQNAGKIKFAVRFYTYNKDTKSVTYSLSTLTNEDVQIRSSLAYDISEVKDDIVDSKSQIINRIVNSEIYDGTGEAATPVFIDKLGSFVNLDTDTGTYKASVQATVEDAGRLTYHWVAYNMNDDETHSAGEPKDITANVASEYIETTDTARKDNKRYYIYQNANNKYTSLPTSVEDFTTYEDGPIYERKSTLTMDSVGYYYARATNRTGNHTAEACTPGYDADENLLYCIVDRPLAPQLTVDTDEIKDHDILNVQTSVVLKDKSVAPQQGDATNKFNGTLSYQWRYAFPDAKDTFYDIIGATAQSYTVKAGLQLNEAGTAVLEVSDELASHGNVLNGDGYYMVIVTNTLNKETKTRTSIVCRITHAAASPKVAVENDNGIVAINTGEPCVIAVDMADLTDTQLEHRTTDDTITYQWYKQQAYNGVTDPDAIKALYAAGDQVVHSVDKLQDGATAATFYPRSDGLYFCEVTNTYNGSVAKRCSPIISALFTAEV